MLEASSNFTVKAVPEVLAERVDGGVDTNASCDAAPACKLRLGEKSRGVIPEAVAVNLYCPVLPVRVHVLKVASPVAPEVVAEGQLLKVPVGAGDP